MTPYKQHILRDEFKSLSALKRGQVLYRYGSISLDDAWTASLHIAPTATWSDIQKVIKVFKSSQKGSYRGLQITSKAPFMTATRAHRSKTTTAVRTSSEKGVSQFEGKKAKLFNSGGDPDWSTSDNYGPPVDICTGSAKILLDNLRLKMTHYLDPMPLDISTEQDYHRLNDLEKKLVSLIRILPSTFLSTMRRLAQGLVLEILTEHDQVIPSTSSFCTTLSRLPKIDSCKAVILVKVLTEANWLTPERFTTWIKERPEMAMQAKRKLSAAIAQRPQHNKSDADDL
ncbi:hypothetical protein MMC34_007287 [Xylographa carneopallida]|nr:hypothetical protein [Xylographa carneopallida]